MRLWTLHPKYLDPRGMVACWREALLAQAVLAGRTRGYRHHPQLQRFREQAKPLHAIAAFLAGIDREARNRGYRFNANKISHRTWTGRMTETDGQLLFEWTHLLNKLRTRAPLLHQQFQTIATPEPHPLFRIIPGDIRDWERSSKPGLRSTITLGNGL